VTIAISARRFSIAIALIAVATGTACSGSAKAPKSPVVRAPSSTPRPLSTPLPPRRELLRSGGVGVIEVAFNRITDEHVTPVDSAALLGAAWQGVQKAASAAGYGEPGAPYFGGDRAADIAAFRNAYTGLPMRLRDNPLTRFTAISAMARSLNDCHTYFLGPTADDSEKDTFGDRPLNDFGMTLSGRPPVITGTEPFSPASTAGLRAGDTILSIDGEDLSGKGPLDAVLLIAEGEEGSTAELRVRRPGLISELTLNLKRVAYTPPNVESQVISGGIGYVRIREWTGPGLAKQMKTILTRFTKDGVKKWIVDLRGNPGGVIDDDAISLFVPDGIIVRARQRDGRILETRASGDALERLAPMAILIDDGSASMSESFALALREYDIAHIVGTKSYGCIGETYIAGLGDGSGLAVTFGLIQGPKTSVELNGVGITPDEIVTRSTDDIIAKRDPQLDAAIAYLAKPTPTP
jgi:carboxyl-terminal processing protease